MDLSVYPATVSIPSLSCGTSPESSTLGGIWSEPGSRIPRSSRTPGHPNLGGPSRKSPQGTMQGPGPCKVVTY